MKLKKILVALLTISMMAALGTGCSKSGGDDNKTDAGNDKSSTTKTYTVHVNVQNAESVIPQDNGVSLFPGSGVFLVYSQDQFLIDYELVIDGDNYTLTSKCYTGDPTNNDAPYTVGDDSTIAGEMVAIATGTVAEQTDTTISLNAAEKVVYTIDKEKQDSIIKEQMLGMFSMAAPDADSLCGEWTSEEVPEMLDSYPAATITVDGNTITNIK